jgi:hypothetical protein
MLDHPTALYSHYPRLTLVVHTFPIPNTKKIMFPDQNQHNLNHEKQHMY